MSTRCPPSPACTATTAASATPARYMLCAMERAQLSCSHTATCCCRLHPVVSSQALRGPAVLSASSQTGRRITEVAVLSGSVVRIWGALERILSRHEHQLSRSDRTMRVLRVDLGAGNSLVGGFRV
jgi:hypothetical protein